MMRVSYIGLIICYTVTLARSENPLGIEFITRCRSNSGCEILQTSESRYRLKDSHSEYAKREYVKKKVDLPVNFRAPNYAAYDYWGYKEQRQEEEQQRQNHRRTFFEDTFYYPQDKRTTYPRVPDLYQFVTSMFGIGAEATTRPEDYHYDRNHATSPYPYETPGSYDFRPTQPNYIPPPKPIRASVIKLETITRSPNPYHSFDYDTGKFYQNFGNILNPVIIQNSKNSQSSTFQDSSKKLTSHTGVSFPVLSKPLAAPPTTLKPPPQFSNFFSDQPSFGLSYLSEYSKNRNRTDYKYPDSVQDKLPPIDFHRIPYLLTTFVPSVTTTRPSETLPITNYDKKIFFPTNPPTIPKSTTKLIDIRNLSQINTANRQKQMTTEIERIKNFDFDVTTFESLEKTVQKIRDPLKDSIREFNPSNETSVEIITNLTVEGLSKGKNDNANIQNHVNYFNVRNLISYEMNKLKNPEPDRFQRKSSGNDSHVKNDEELLHLVNFNDELSLDAKILKDTNWDGFSTTPPNLMIETRPTKFFLNQTQIQVKTIPNSQSIQQFRFKPTFGSQINETKAEKDFWESDVVTRTTIPNVDLTTATLEVKTTTEKLELPTTTEILSFSIVSETTETTELMTSPEILTTQDENLGSMKLKDTSEQQTTTEPLNKTTTTELPTSREILKTSFSPESTTPYFQKRKYSRRAKFLNYTPYTTSTTTITTELPKKVFNRNNFPRRQKPNITLAFGNKNIIKTVETYAKDEVMKFSDEDLTKKKRKPGKRRRFYKRRNSTSEPIIAE